jgi:hypothetical protein
MKRDFIWVPHLSTRRCRRPWRRNSPALPIYYYVRTTLLLTSSPAQLIKVRTELNCVHEFCIYEFAAMFYASSYSSHVVCDYASPQDEFSWEPIALVDCFRHCFAVTSWLFWWFHKVGWLIRPPFLFRDVNSYGFAGTEIPILILKTWL